ncbi:MAG: hypothetical protein AAF982_12590 [Pseudomonadota bacterium]
MVSSSACRSGPARTVSAQAAESFVAYRKKIRKPLTATAAERLARVLKKIFEQGRDPSDAPAMAEARGWASIRPDWYFRKVEQHDERSDHTPRSGSSDGNGRGAHHGLMAGFAVVADPEAG